MYSPAEPNFSEAICTEWLLGTEGNGDILIESTRIWSSRIQRVLRILVPTLRLFIRGPLN